MKSEGKDKIKRVLGIYTGLMEGRSINKAKAAEEYNVTKRSIQRDIDDIRSFLDWQTKRKGYVDSVIYDSRKKGYCLEHISKTKFTNSEILALCKILLDSRAFIKEEMKIMLAKLISCCVPKDDQKMIKDLIRNEEYYYVELKHGVKFMDMMWDIGQAIQGHNYIEVEYNKKKGMVKRKLKPAAIMFSEYYFYLTAFIDDEEVQKRFDVLNDSFPTIYRIDRIKKLKVLNEKFHIPYKDRFQEGEFRKRIQFMYGGKLQRVKFRYYGDNIENVQDRLPTAKILSEENGVYTISAEVFGSGIDMWLRSQGDEIERLN